jgi:hypothetical protein
MMNSKRVTALWLMSLLICLTLWAESPIQRSSPLSSLSVGATGQTMAFRNSSVAHRIEQTKSGQFYVLAMDGYGTTNEVGKPQLPVLRYDVEVPVDATVTLQVTNSTMQEHALSEWGSNFPIMPFQPSMSRLPGTEVTFALDGSAYATNGYVLNRIARLAAERIVRNRKLVTIELNVVDYNPAQGIIRVYSDIQVALTYGSQAKQVQSQGKYRSASFDRSIQDALLLPSAAATAAAKEGYLIITPPEYQQALATFVQTKQQTYDVTLATTTTTGTTNTSIKAYIQNAYDTWAVPPVYVLLVGDVDKIPSWGSSVPTDLYYSTVAGTDYFPDLYLGRVSVTSVTQLNNWIAKALHAQTTKAHSWIAGADQTPLGYGLGVDGETDYCVSHYFDPIGWTSMKNKVSVYGSGILSRIQNDVNNGVAMVSYNGHGAATAWIDGMNWSKYDVDALTNSVYPVVLAFGCNTGEYTQDECLGESWIRATHGGTAYMGSTITSAWREDGYLDRGIYAACSAGMTQFGEIVNNGKHQVFLEEGDVPKVQQYYEQYNILGDPSQEILSSGGQVPTSPLPPMLASPVNGAVNQALSPTLQWGSSIGATTYRLQVSPNPAFTSGTLVVDDSALVSTSRQVGPLDTGMTYYWRVNAANSAGASAYSSSWSFATQVSPATIVDNWLYQDGIVAPWRDSSWSSTINYASTEQVYSGTSSLKAIQQAWGAVSMRSGPMGNGIDVPPTPYTGIEFAVYNTTPGLVLNVFGYNDQGDVFPDNVQSSIPTNQWTIITVPMSQLNPSNYVIHRVNIQNYTRLAPTYFVDNVRFVSASTVLAAIEHPSPLPTTFSLEQNYPNPFNPSTDINFGLPEDAYVTLKIYNLLGEEVKVLLDRRETAGTKSVRFDGGGLPSGLYFYRVAIQPLGSASQSSGRIFTSTKKMVLMK